MSKFKVGDKVKVTYEATVVDKNNYTDTWYVERDASGIRRNSIVLTPEMELLAPAMPAVGSILEFKYVGEPARILRILASKQHWDEIVSMADHSSIRVVEEGDQST